MQKFHCIYLPYVYVSWKSYKEFLMTNYDIISIFFSSIIHSRKSKKKMNECTYYVHIQSGNVARRERLRCAEQKCCAQHTIYPADLELQMYYLCTIPT